MARTGHDDVAAVAVAFAGLLAAEMGASVTRVVDAAASWDAGHANALRQFLHAGKDECRRDAPGAMHDVGAFLLTDDPAQAAMWPPSRSILVVPGRATDTEAAPAPVPELVVQARVGLLDIFAGRDGKPRPLPGHQMAYSAGTAAFNALVAAWLVSPQDTGPMSIGVEDVALWVNWKHFLGAMAGDTTMGIGRVEDWNALRCKDGHVAITFQDKDMPALAALTGNPLFLEARFATRKLRARNIDAIDRAIEHWARDLTRATVVERAQDLRIPIGPVITPDELSEERQIVARGFLREDVVPRRPRLPALWSVVPVPAERSVQ